MLSKLFLRNARSLVKPIRTNIAPTKAHVAPKIKPVFQDSYSKNLEAESRFFTTHNIPQSEVQYTHIDDNEKICYQYTLETFPLYILEARNRPITNRNTHEYQIVQIIHFQLSKACTYARSNKPDNQFKTAILHEAKLDFDSSELWFGYIKTQAALLEKVVNKLTTRELIAALQVIRTNTNAMKQAFPNIVTEIVEILDNEILRLEKPFTMEIAQEFGGEKFFRLLAHIGKTVCCSSKDIILLKDLAHDIGMKKSGIQYDTNMIHTLGTTSCRTVLKAIEKVEANITYKNNLNSVTTDFISDQDFASIQNAKAKLVEVIER